LYCSDWLCRYLQEQYDYLYRLAVRATDWTPSAAAADTEAGEPNNNYNNNDNNADTGYSEVVPGNDAKPPSHSAQHYVGDDAGDDANGVGYDMRL